MAAACRCWLFYLFRLLSFTVRIYASQDCYVLLAAGTLALENAGMMVSCEVLVDLIKHSCLAKYNDINPSTYSKLLQTLCKETLIGQSHETHTTLHFVPLAPACVVLRILIPLYAILLPVEPLEYRIASIFILGGGTYIILLALKILVGLGLQTHAAWYLKRCKEGCRPHTD